MINKSKIFKAFPIPIELTVQSHQFIVRQSSLWNSFVNKNRVFLLKFNFLEMNSEK
jgi:hypothetical protein